MKPMKKQKITRKLGQLLGSLAKTLAEAPKEITQGVMETWQEGKPKTLGEPVALSKAEEPLQVWFFQAEGSALKVGCDSLESAISRAKKSPRGGEILMPDGSVIHIEPVQV